MLLEPDLDEARFFCFTDLRCERVPLFAVEPNRAGQSLDNGNLPALSLMRIR